MLYPLGFLPEASGFKRPGCMYSTKLSLKQHCDAYLPALIAFIYTYKEEMNLRLPSSPSLDRLNLLAGIVTKSPGVVTGLDRWSLLTGAGPPNPHCYFWALLSFLSWGTELLDQRERVFKHSTISERSLGWNEFMGFNRLRKLYKHFTYFLACLMKQVPRINFLGSHVTT